MARPSTPHRPPAPGPAGSPDRAAGPAPSFLDGQSRVEVVIEVPRGGFVKPSADGSGVDLVSPLPSPFNYGSIVGTRGPDGDPWDAVVLGAAVTRGATVSGRVWGRVDFRDAGTSDPKWVVGSRPPRRRDWAAIRTFFALYGVLKCTRDLLQGGRPASGIVRIVRWQPRGR